MKIVNKTNDWLPSIFEDFFPENKLDVINYERFSIPAANIKENFSNFVIELALPGWKKENIAIEIEKNVLIVASKSLINEDNLKEEATKFTRREFKITAFKRSFALPETVNKEHIEANYENGVLSIKLPKLDEAKNIKRMVEIS